MFPADTDQPNSKKRLSLSGFVPANEKSAMNEVEDQPELSKGTVGMMAKYWDAGKVKTRLAQSLADDAVGIRQWQNDHYRTTNLETAYRVSAALHRRFVMHLAESLTGCGDVRHLVVAPQESIPDFEAELDAHQTSSREWLIVDQGDGDLGDRMKRWFLKQLTEPTSDDRNSKLPNRAVMIGTDCPLLRSQDLEEALGYLNKFDIVLGPAEDGGYYLIGIAGWRSESEIAAVFDEVDWSTEKVLDQTLAAVGRLGWNVKLLQSRSDVDTSDDLANLLDLCDLPDASESHARLRADLLSILALQQSSHD